MRLRTVAFVLLCLFGLSLVWAMQPTRKRNISRNKPADKRVYLVHSDQLRYDQYRNGDAQILVGNVHFRHMGANLYCDSANFFEQSNSFEAFGHVKMLQGDTLKLFSDYAYYDGNAQIAQARYNVILKHRQSTLYTDSLDYDRLYNFGNFFEGGKLVDNGSTLTSDWGEYHTDTKMAMFYYDVRLRNKKFYLTTDSLYYDTRTSRAHIVGPSNIISGTSHIYSEDGYYNTKTETSELFGRSVMKDKGRSIVGDSVYHDSKNGLSHAYWNVVYVDSINKNKMTGDYCEYNDSTGYAMATKRAVAIDYSQKDSLFMHADTFKLYTYNINTDSVYRKIYGYNKVRAYRIDVQAVCDSLVYNSKDSCMTMYKDPIVWNNNQQLFGEEIRVYIKDSTIHRAHIIGQAFSTEQMPDTVHFNQVSSREMLAYFEKGEIYETDAVGNVLIVYYPIDDADSSLIGLNYTETPWMKMYLEKRKMKKIWMESPTGTLYPMTQIPPSKYFLPQYAWFDYIRPRNKEDIFNWRPKKAGQELKEIKRREAPKQKLSKKGEVL
ncbi:MAG: hypothetical protein IKZ62_03465 [Prevotella sp.]|nr:hypothetical protein [Prevotella sp.]